MNVSITRRPKLLNKELCHVSSPNVQTYHVAGLFAALVLAGCGGGDSGVENTLRADLEVLQEDFDDLQADLKDAQDDLKDAEDRAEDAAEDLADAQSDTADAIRNAQRERDEARRQAQTLEANQRAEKLKAAFPGGALAAPLPTISPTASPVTITVPERACRCSREVVTVPPRSPGQGLDSATMALTAAPTPARRSFTRTPN